MAIDCDVPNPCETCDKVIKGCSEKCTPRIIFEYEFRIGAMQDDIDRLKAELKKWGYSENV